MAVDYSQKTTQELEELMENYMEVMGDLQPTSHTASLVAGAVKKIHTEILKRKRHHKPIYA